MKSCWIRCRSRARRHGASNCRRRRLHGPMLLLPAALSTGRAFASRVSKLLSSWGGEAAQVNAWWKRIAMEREGRASFSRTTYPTLSPLFFPAVNIPNLIDTTRRDRFVFFFFFFFFFLILLIPLHHSGTATVRHLCFQCTWHYNNLSLFFKIIYRWRIRRSSKMAQSLCITPSSSSSFRSIDSSSSMFKTTFLAKVNIIRVVFRSSFPFHCVKSRWLDFFLFLKGGMPKGSLP